MPEFLPSSPNLSPEDRHSTEPLLLSHEVRAEDYTLTIAAVSIKGPDKPGDGGEIGKYDRQDTIVVTGGGAGIVADGVGSRPNGARASEVAAGMLASAFDQLQAAQTTGLSRRAAVQYVTDGLAEASLAVKQEAPSGAAVVLGVAPVTVEGRSCMAVVQAGDCALTTQLHGQGYIKPPQLNREGDGPGSWVGVGDERDEATGQLPPGTEVRARAEISLLGLLPGATYVAGSDGFWSRVRSLASAGEDVIAELHAAADTAQLRAALERVARVPDTDDGSAIAWQVRHDA